MKESNKIPNKIILNVIKPEGKLIKLKPPKRRINYNFVDFDKKRDKNGKVRKVEQNENNM